MTTTWAASPTYSNCVAATCTTGTEAAPTLATEGLSLIGLGAVAAHVEASTPFSAGTLDAYLYNPQSSAWNRAPDLDLTVRGGIARQGFAGFEVPSPVGRLAYVPNGLGTACTVYLNGSAR